MLGLTTDSFNQNSGNHDRRYGRDTQMHADTSAGTRSRTRDRGTSQAELESLARTIESQIIPRLMLAHSTSTGEIAAHADRDAVVSPADLIDFTAIVINADISAVGSAVERFLMRGISAEHLCLELLAPTARRLGDMWNDDLCDFVGVTLGLGRLQQVLHDLAPSLQPTVELRTAGSRILLVPAPGDQHSLGLTMVREFFRSAGWDVRGGSGCETRDIQTMLGAEWFDMAGLSVGSQCGLEPLAEHIRMIRAASRNRHIGILVGGAIFIEQPSLVQIVGADGTALDAREAVVVAEGIAALRR